MTQIPSDYVESHQQARRLDQAVADNYVKHTLIGDPELDPIMQELSSMPPDDLHRFIGAAVEQHDEVARKAPQVLRDFFKNLEEPPPWLNRRAFEPGIRAFHANVDLMLAAFVTGVLVEGFSTRIAKSFRITGRVAATKRRLQQNNRHMLEIFFPGGLDRDGDGWKLSTRIRFVHSRIRALLANSDDWDHEAWGVPVSTAHLGYAISVFSKRLLDYSRLLGTSYNKEERESVMSVWRYAGHLMGIPDTILYRDTAEAENLYKVGFICEPPADADSVAVANTLIQAIPLVAGITDPVEKEELLTLAYRLSRALIGNRLADGFEFPKHPTIGTLFAFRTKERVKRLLKGTPLIRAGNFTQLLQISVYDEGGLSYRMPDHVHTSKSIEW